MQFVVVITYHQHFIISSISTRGTKRFDRSYTAVHFTTYSFMLYELTIEPWYLLMLMTVFI
jgi:hypothetical protein